MVRFKYWSQRAVSKRVVNSFSFEVVSKQVVNSFSFEVKDEICEGNDYPKAHVIYIKL